MPNSSILSPHIWDPHGSFSGLLCVCICKLIAFSQHIVHGRSHSHESWRSIANILVCSRDLQPQSVLTPQRELSQLHSPSYSPHTNAVLVNRPHIPKKLNDQRMARTRSKFYLFATSVELYPSVMVSRVFCIASWRGSCALISLSVLSQSSEVLPSTSSHSPVCCCSSQGLRGGPYFPKWH